MARKAKPVHYQAPIDPIDLAVANGDIIPFCRMNVIKYVFRYENHSDGKLASLLKALHYLLMLIAYEVKPGVNRNEIDAVFLGCKEMIAGLGSGKATTD